MFIQYIYMTFASFQNGDLPNRKAQSVPALFSKHTPGKYMYILHMNFLAISYANTRNSVYVFLFQF